MPKNVRNWWITGRADGRKDAVGFGPQSKDGTIRVRIQQRDAGSVTDALSIEGYADNGTLTLNVFGPDGERIFQHITKR